MDWPRISLSSRAGFDVDALAEAPNDAANGVFVHRTAVLGEEYAVVVAGFGAFALGEVLPDGGGGLGGDGHVAFFVALAGHLDFAGFEVGVGAEHLAEFGDAEHRIEQGEDDGFVTLGGGTAVGAFALAGAFVGLGVIAGVEELLHLGLGVGFDDGFFGPGRGVHPDDVLCDDAALGGPGPQGGEAGVVVDEGLFGEAVHCGEEGFNLGEGDAGQGGISVQVGLEFAEGVGVIGDGARAETAGVGVEQVAFDGLGEGDLIHPGDLLLGASRVDKLDGRVDNLGVRFF